VTLFNQIARRVVVLLLLLGVAVPSLTGFQNSAGGFRITRDIHRALNTISAASLRRNLMFIASDEMKGRNTPSPELDRAASFIAAQFRRAGLRPVGDDGYFQTANWVQPMRNPKDFSLSIELDGQKINAQANQVSFNFDGALKIQDVPVVKVPFGNTANLAELKQRDIEGKIVVTELPNTQRLDRARRGEAFQTQWTFFALLQSLKAAMVLSFDRDASSGTGFNAGRLIDPENRPAQSSAPSATQTSNSLPVVQLAGAEGAKLYDALPIGTTRARVLLHVEGPGEVPMKIRNVIGVLRGSDPVLRDTYVLVTAHYDHIGVNPNVPGPDKIFNGANDDGSGTVSVIEIANALSKLRRRPKRTIVFMTVFGEEKGLLGSRYYGRHPVFPIEKTVADINLEQVGRTDDSEGPQVGTCAMTGFDFSDVGEIFKAAGELTGIKVFKHPTKSDTYFGRSDNQALADQGVPAHTLSVAYEYPDYHGVADTWDKLDYDNMAKVDRMVAVGLLMIANNLAEPKWNETNPKAAKYLKAWRERRAK
jgi:hypothetical protein